MKSILIFILLALLINCNGIDKKNSKKLEISQKEVKKVINIDDSELSLINFFDRKYKVNGYQIPDNLNGDIYPYYSYMDMSTGVFSVNFIGKTEKERYYWSVYNENGFFKNKKIENVSSIIIENNLNDRIENYYVIANYLDKKYIQNYDATSGEFDVKDYAERKIYLYIGNRVWKLLKTVKPEEISENYLRFDLDLLKSAKDNIINNENSLKTEKIQFPKLSRWAIDCESNKSMSIETNINNIQFGIPGRFSMNAQLKKVNENKYELYFTDFPPIISLSPEMQKWHNMDNTKPVGTLEIMDDNHLKLTWFGFYLKKTQRYIETENPFSKMDKTVSLIKCAD